MVDDPVQRRSHSGSPAALVTPAARSGRDTTDPTELVELAAAIAQEVSEGLLAALGGDRTAIAVHSKSTSTDLVTGMDRWAEKTIVERILQSRPHDGIVGEEGADIDGTSGVTWCVDPIDGTVNFVHAMPGFNVSIAALRDGATVAGVVQSPLHRDVFTAVRGGGSFHNGQRLAAVEAVPMSRAVVGTGFGYDPARRRRQAEVLTEVIGSIADIRRVGAAALDLCWVACGRLDAYWEVGLNPWDHAAGALVASEAGVRCAGLSGQPPSSDFVLAAPEPLWSELRDLLVEVDAERV